MSSVPGYDSLSNVLGAAYHQAARGKGKERHARDKPFDKQPIMEISRMVGPGYATGQAMKKLQEAKSMMDRGQLAAAKAEALGAINYTAAFFLLIEEAETERDKAQAQVKVALQLAVNMVWDIQPQTCTANTAGTIGREISSLTFSHASAALEAYGREKVREGMQRAAGLVSHSAYGTAYWAILADMETLK